MSRNPVTALLCLAISLLPIGAGGNEGGADAPLGRSTAYEPPVLRDVDDRIIDLMELDAGRDAGAGSDTTITVKADRVIVRKADTANQDGWVVECLRASDRCKLIVYADGTTLLWRLRTLVCGAPENTVVPGDAQMLVGATRRIFSDEKGCFEDLRVTSTGKIQTD